MWQAAAGGAVLGAVAGSFGKRSRSSVQLAPESALEREAGKTAQDQLSQLSNLTNLGPGSQDVTSGLEAQRNLAQLLSNYSQGGYMPQDNDFISAQRLGAQLFQPQQLQLQQQFMDDDEQIARVAARMGRDPNDPVLRNQLQQQRNRLMSQFGAQQNAFIAEQAQNMPMQRLGFAQQLAQVRGGLASQAMANREALLRMGQGIRQSEQNFRMGTASRTVQEGGGLAGAISGGLAGLGAGMQAAPGLSSLFSGFGSSGAAAPTMMAGQSNRFVGNIG